VSVSFDAGWDTLGQAMALWNYPAIAEVMRIVKVSDPDNLLSVAANKLRITNHSQANSVARITLLHVIVAPGTSALPTIG